MSRRFHAALTALAAAACAFAVSQAHAQAILAAQVNGVGIAQERLERGFEEELGQRKLNLLQIHSPERVKQIKREVLDNLIEQELFSQAAREAHIAVTADDVEEAFQATKKAFRSADAFEQRLRLEGLTPETYRELVRKQVLGRKYAQRIAARAPRVTDDEVHRFYADHPEKFTRPEQVRLRHIVINVPPGASAAVRAEKQELIRRILERAHAGEDFDALARAYSEAPTRQWGGEMDPLGRGQAARPVEDAVFALAAGGLTDVIATGDALQVFKVEGHDEALVVREDEVRERIREHLQALRASRAITEDAARLRAAGEVKILLPL